MKSQFLLGQRSSFGAYSLRLLVKSIQFTCFIAPFFAWIVKTRQGARKDHEFQSRLRVMDIDEARGADLVYGLLLCRYNQDQTNSLCLKREIKLRK